MIFGCSQPRELWFIDFNYVHMYTYMYVLLRVIPLYMYIVQIEVRIKTWFRLQLCTSKMARNHTYVYNDCLCTT